MAVETELDLAELAPVVAEALSGDVRIVAAQRLSGGASRETYSVDIEIDGRSEQLILQRSAVGAADTVKDFGAEAEVLMAAARVGVLVPELLASSADDAPLGRPFLLSRHVAGESIARRIQRNDEYAIARSRFAADCGRELSRLHSIAPSSVGRLTYEDPLERYREVLIELDQPHPTFELALRWLETNRPTRGETTVVHGDFRLGNLLIGDAGLTAVIDWELAHLGDPMEDLGWLCTKAWRFGGPGEVGGIGSLDDLCDAYELESSAPIDRDVVRWWQILGSLKWGIICISQASRHLTGLTRSHELAAIGRRVCENEWDLLELLP